MCNSNLKLRLDEINKIKDYLNSKINIIKKQCYHIVLKCKKNTESINPKVSKTTNGKTMILSTCAICESKKSKFIREQQAEGLLSNLGIRTPLIKIPLLGDILF